VLLRHSYIHWWTSFSRTKLCPNRCYLTFFHIPERSIALKTGWFKGLKLIPTCYANKVLLKVAHAFLYTWMDFFQSRKLCPSRCYLTFFHFPTFNCTSKTTGWFTGAEIDPNLPTLTSVTQGSTHSYIHGWTSFVASNCAQPFILPSSILNVQH
jgi:hypothetical protein